MSFGGDAWMKEFDEAVKMTDEINSKVAERNEMARHGEDTSRLVAATRRKLNMLSTLADRLQTLLGNNNETAPKAKELRKREDMLFGIRFKVKQLTAQLSNTQPSSRDKLFDKDKKTPALETERTVDLDNRGVIQMQQEVIKQQDEQLKGLESSVSTTKHIALAINGELDLHTRLLDELDADVESTNSRFTNTQKKLATLTKRANKTCNFIYILLTIMGLLIVLLVLVKLSKFF